MALEATTHAMLDCWHMASIDVPNQCLAPGGQGSHKPTMNGTACHRLAIRFYSLSCCSASSTITGFYLPFVLPPVFNTITRPSNRCVCQERFPPMAISSTPYTIYVSHNGSASLDVV